MQIPTRRSHRTNPGIALLLLICSASASAAISPDHPELLQQGILDAYNAGQPSVVVPAGIYLVPSANGAHLLFQNMSNFEIDARGATFVFQDQTASGIVFYNCTGVYLHGATVYYGIPPFSQGVIQAVASDRSSLDIQIDAGYPTNLDDPKYFSPNLVGNVVDSATRWWKRNTWGDFYGTGTQRLGTNTFRIYTNFIGASVGDLVALRPGTGASDFDVLLCSRMNLSDLTILNSPLFGIYEFQGGDLGANTYSNITIKRGNRPAGAVTDPLFSTSADGFHSTEARTGPHVENCSFEGMSDDGIAVHGFYSWVIQASGNALIVSDTATGSGPNFRVGDPLQLIDPQNNPAGNAIVAGVTALPSFTNSRQSARQTVRDLTVGPYYQVTIDRSLTAGFDYLAGNPNASGAGFVLQNNSIRNHRGRGILVKGNNGTIQGNTIDGSTLAGIKAGPEFYWGEAGFVSNLLIQGNTINNVGYQAGGTAGIFLAPDPTVSPAGGYQNISIAGNTFSNFDVPAIFLTSATGVQISGNTFTNLQNAVPFNPYYLGQDVLQGTLVFLAQSNGVQFGTNTLSQLGPANAFFVETLPGTTVSGVGYVTPVASSDADFSGVQGTANWQYGYFPAGDLNSFTLLPVFNSTAGRWQHTTFGPPWTAHLAGSQFAPNGVNSGAEEWAARRWTSTFTGAATIVGHLAKSQIDSNSTGVYGRIYLNRSLLYEHFIQGTDGTGVQYSLDVPLNQGDTVDFAVAPNGLDWSDTTVFSSSILSSTNLNQTVTIQTSPTALQFSLDGTAYTAPQTLSLPRGTHTIAVASPQAGTPGSQYVFASWSDGGAASHSIALGSSPLTLTANFQVQYQLNLSASPASGGTVTPAAGGFYNAGANVNLSATPAQGYSFAGWTGDLSGTANPQSIAMSAPHRVTANFTAINTSCSLALSINSVNLPPTGTSAVEACPNNSGQPSCGVAPETPRPFTVTPSAACGAWTATSSNPEFLQITAGASGSGNGSVSYALLTNTHTSPQTYSITVASGAASATYSLTEAGNADSEVYRQIYALYEQLLGRDPDAGGFGFWSGAGGAGLGQMADSFLTSPEAFNSDFAVMAAYQAATGAPPTFAQFTVAAASLRAGVQTVPGLFNSLSGAGYSAASLYQNLLGRAPGTNDSACINSGLSQCFQNIIGYPAANTPVGAPNNEFQNTGSYRAGPDHSNALYLQMIYYVTVSRNPDPGGFAFWLSVANSGGPGLLFQGGAGYAARIQILGPGTPNQGFIGSPEFQGLFLN